MSKEELRNNKRKPAEHRVADRDEKGHRLETLKSAWKRATHKQRTVTITGGDGKTRQSLRWERTDETPSLKAWARANHSELMASWFHNKRANTANLQLGLGKTKKKSKSNKSSAPSKG